MCEPILINKDIFSRFETRVISISYAADVKSTGTFQTSKFISLFRYFFATVKTLVIFRPDSVYFVPSLTGTPFFRDLIFMLVMRMSRARRIYHIHGMGLWESAERSSLFRYFYRFAFNGSEVIILSELLRSEIRFLTPSKTHILPNGIMNTPIHMRKPDNSLVKLLFVSNFYSYKGVDDLIKLLAKVKAAGYSFTCSIVGEEKDITYRELDSLIVNNDLTKQVTCLGSLRGEALYQLFIDSDIFIYPTKKDAMPLVILEAMRSGVAVLTNPVGAIPEMLELTSDLHPTPENLIALLHDPEKISKLGNSNRQLFEDRFTLDQFHQNLFNILSEIQK